MLHFLLHLTSVTFPLFSAFWIKGGEWVLGHYDLLMSTSGWCLDIMHAHEEPLNILHLIYLREDWETPNRRFFKVQVQKPRERFQLQTTDQEAQND